MKFHIPTLSGTVTFFLSVIKDIDYFRKMNIITSEDVKHLKEELLFLIDTMKK